MKSYEIHFICHGETEESKQGVYIGKTDVPLSEKGRELLQKYDSEYKYPGTPVLFSSPLKRCTETCNIIYPSLKPIIIDDLREINFGDWEGKTAEELKDNPDFVQWLGNSAKLSPPHGESNENFTRRICLCFEKIVGGLLKTGNHTAVIVTHGGVIMTLLAVYGLPQANVFDWQMDNGFGYSIRINPMLWMRDKVTEVYSVVPLIPESDNNYND